MPIKKEHYPPDWAEISRAVREEAEQCCEWCGIANGIIITPQDRQMIGADERHRIIAKTQQLNDQLEAWGLHIKTTEARVLKLLGFSKVVLTVAHLDRNKENNERANLAALCQKCHFNYDQYPNIAKRKANKSHAKRLQTQIELWTSTPFFLPPTANIL